MKVIYIAHALSAPDAEGMAENRRKAALWCAWLCRHFEVATVADWIVMSSVLKETPENRALGLACDVALVERCDVLVLVGTRVSDGMQLEAEHARSKGIPVIDLTTIGNELPEDDHYFHGDVNSRLRVHGIKRRLAA